MLTVFVFSTFFVFKVINCHSDNDYHSFDDYYLKPVNWNKFSFQIVIDDQTIEIEFKKVNMTGPDQLFRSKITRFTKRTICLELADQVKIYSIKDSRIISSISQKDGARTYKITPQFYGPNLWRFEEVPKKEEKAKPISLLSVVDKNGKLIGSDSTLTAVLNSGETWTFSGAFTWKTHAFYVFSLSGNFVILRQHKLVRSASEYHQAFYAYYLAIPASSYSFLPTKHAPLLFYTDHSETFRSDFKDLIDRSASERRKCLLSLDRQSRDLLEFLKHTNIKTAALCSEKSIPLLKVLHDRKGALNSKNVFAYKHLHPSDRPQVGMIAEDHVFCCNENLELSDLCTLNKSFAESKISAQDVVADYLTFDKATCHLVVPVRESTSISPRRLSLYTCSSIKSCFVCQTVAHTQGCRYVDKCMEKSKTFGKREIRTENWLAPKELPCILTLPYQINEKGNLLFPMTTYYNDDDITWHPGLGFSFQVDGKPFNHSYSNETHVAEIFLLKKGGRILTLNYNYSCGTRYTRDFTISKLFPEKPVSQPQGTSIGSIILALVAIVFVAVGGYAAYYFMVKANQVRREIDADSAPTSSGVGEISIPLKKLVPKNT